MPRRQVNVKRNTKNVNKKRKTRKPAPKARVVRPVRRVRPLARIATARPVNGRLHQDSAPAVAAAQAHFDPVHSKPARLPWDVRASVPVRDYDVFNVSTFPNKASGAPYPPNAPVLLWVAFSGSVAAIKGVVQDADGTYNVFNMLGGSPVPPAAESRVIGAAVELLYHGPVLDMGARFSYIMWGRSQTTYNNAHAGIPSEVDLANELYAHHGRLDRHMIIPWTGGDMSWQVANDITWGDGSRTRGYKLETGTATSLAGWGFGDPVGSQPPRAGMVIQVPALALQSGNLQIRLTRHIEYYHDSHAALTAVGNPTPAGNQLVQVIQAHAARKDVVRHGTLEEYAHTAGRLIREFVGTYIPAHLPSVKKVASVAQRVVRKASAGVAGATRLLDGLALL